MIVPHESCENWVFELAMCPVDPRYLAHRICMNFLSAAKMQGSHWGCGYTRQTSPDPIPDHFLLPPFLIFQRSKHCLPLSTTGLLYQGQVQSWLIYSYFLQKDMKSVLKGTHSTKANDEILTEDEDRKNITEPEECQETFTSFYDVL